MFTSPALPTHACTAKTPPLPVGAAGMRGTDMRWGDTVGRPLCTSLHEATAGWGWGRLRQACSGGALTPPQIGAQTPQPKSGPTKRPQLAPQHCCQLSSLPTLISLLQHLPHP